MIHTKIWSFTIFEKKTKKKIVENEDQKNKKIIAGYCSNVKKEKLNFKIFYLIKKYIKKVIK